MTRTTEVRDKVSSQAEVEEIEYEDDEDDDGEPKFGRLLLFLMLAVALCGVLTWVMGRFFPDFPNFT
jgi:hypothetical protein